MTTKKKTIEITNTVLVSALKKAGKIPAKAQQVKCWVSVPGGGDYSNMDLEIGPHDDLNLKVSYCLPVGPQVV